MDMCSDPLPVKTSGAIRRATTIDVDDVWSVVHEAAQALHARGIHQWHQNYPTRDTVEADVRDARLFALDRDGRIDAVVTLNYEQDPLWDTLPWRIAGRALVVHRLCVRPSAQRAGLGGRLMSFAETIADVEHAQCIRLDAYSENSDALRLYEGRGYHRVGSLLFPHRVAPFICFERATRWSSPGDRS
jgi:ribosomal protein S18 acetylase RimI-like enzyme